MTEIVLNTNTFPEPILHLIRTEKVRVKEIDGMIQLFPVKENVVCPLLGLAADSSLTVEKFRAMTHDETEIQQ